MIVKQDSLKIEKSRVKEAIGKVVNSENGIDLILAIRRLGGVDANSIPIGKSEKTHYYCGRHGLMSDIMTLIKTADFKAYIRILEREQFIKEDK